MEQSNFAKLNSINVSGLIEKKSGLSYLAWADAWGEAKKVFPNATYVIYEREDGCIYWTDGRTCWVKTGVIIDGLEHIEYLPVMDYRNKSIPLDDVTSTDVNKTIQRSLTKALARHGLGLYIYAGEDLPEEERAEEQAKMTEKIRNNPPMEAAGVTFEVQERYVCDRCQAEFPAYIYNGKQYTSKDAYEGAKKKCGGAALCKACQAQAVENENAG